MPVDSKVFVACRLGGEVAKLLPSFVKSHVENRIGICIPNDADARVQKQTERGRVEHEGQKGCLFKGSMRFLSQYFSLNCSNNVTEADFLLDGSRRGFRKENSHAAFSGMSNDTGNLARDLSLTV